MTRTMMENYFEHRGKAFRFFTMIVVPAAVYLVIFIAVTYPLILKFSSHFFCDDNDGLGMIWNVWWVDKAVTQLHTSFWHTSYLFYPYGVNLYPHTLSPFNGLLAIFILPFFTLPQTYNILILFSFVGAGLTAFWLSFYITRSYRSSLVAGFIFSFSNYHFAHLPGHLNLVSLEWIPLFVLCFYLLLERPSLRIALGSALCLFAVILCDYYYFFYCIVLAALMIVWFVVQKRDVLFLFKKNYQLPIGVFFFACLLSSGLIVFKLFQSIQNETLIGVHEPWRYSTDLFSPFVYGSLLRFSNLTEGFWSRLPGNTAENSVYMGLSVIILLIYTYMQRKKIREKSIYLWFIALVFFFVLSLGPYLQLLGKSVPYVPMPYRLIETLIPPIQISGCPGRMMVMVMLSAAVICAMGLDSLFRASIKTRLLASVLLLVLFVEFFPAAMKPFRAQVPEYVMILRGLPNEGGVIDLVNDAAHATYYSTVYDKPVWTGKIARLPEKLSEKKQRILDTAKSGEVDTLYVKYGFRYAILDNGKLYDLKTSAVYESDSLFYQPY